MSFAKLAESPFMKGNDITSPMTVTIESTRETMFKDQKTGEDRASGILKFYDIDKEFILNKTNLIYLLKELGNDERQWINKEITLRTMPWRDSRTGQMTKKVFIEVEQKAPSTNGSGRKAAAALSSTDDVPTTWPDPEPVPVAAETEDQSLPWEGEIPDPGQPMSASQKRRKNSY